MSTVNLLSRLSSWAAAVRQKICYCYARFTLIVVGESCLVLCSPHERPPSCVTVYITVSGLLILPIAYNCGLSSKGLSSWQAVCSRKNVPAA